MNLNTIIIDGVEKEYLGIHRAYQGYAFIYKDKEKNKFSHCSYNVLNLYKLNYLRTQMTPEQRDFEDLHYESNSFFKLNDKYNYLVVYDLEDEKVILLFNQEGEIVPNSVSLKDLEKVEGHGMYLLKNSKNYQEQAERKVKKWFGNDMKKELPYTSDFQILKYLDCYIYQDFAGTLRLNGFEELSENEKEIKKDLNTGWSDYYEGKYTLKELMNSYIKTNMSIQGFMECFYDMFIDNNNEFCSEEKIGKIIEGIEAPFNKF